jgi:hypothetical protein
MNNSQNKYGFANDKRTAFFVCIILSKYQEILIIILYYFDMHECNFVVRLGRLMNFLSLFYRQTSSMLREQTLKIILSFF